MEQLDENREHVDRIVRLMWEQVGYFSNELDQYASGLFERPIRGSWGVFVHVAKHGEPDWIPGNHWWWEHLSENPHYPPMPRIESLNAFASVYLHEVAHGWLYLLTDHEKGGPFEDDRDEEKVCWEISRVICHLLGLQFVECPASLETK